MAEYRVVVTGMAGFSPLGLDWEQSLDALENNRSGIRFMPDWASVPDLDTRLAGPVEGFTLPDTYTRKKTRAMGRVSLMSVRASELALEAAGLLSDENLADGRTGVGYGSSSGCTKAVQEFTNLMTPGSTSRPNSTSYLRMMPHTTAVSIAMHFGLKGRIIPTSSACTSGSQGIGYAYEAVRFGRVRRMLGGGAEGLCASQAAVFDTLYATSTRNDSPSTTPAPFDANRDGLVVGEGACTLVLERLEDALERGAHIHAEVVGFGSSCDGAHATRPDVEQMAAAMQLALDDAGLSGSDIGYVNAHGTATEHGDIAESQATAAVIGRVPVSSLKGHTGHTLGACGALESWLSIEMMNLGRFAPTLNLHEVDPRCGELDYIQDTMRSLDVDHVMNNNFAFGGVNSSLIFRRWRG